MKTEFTLTKCKSKAAYQTKLKKQSKLDLDKVKKQFKVILETPILLVIKSEGIEIIVHGFGDLLFKKCDDLELIRKIAENVYDVGLK